MMTDATALALDGSESPSCAYPSIVGGAVANRSAGVARRFEPTVAA
jgi:hypothetical protein